MTRQEVEARCLALIKDQLAIPGEAGDDVTLADTLDDLGADSLDRVALLITMEQTFGVDLTDDVAEGWETVGQLIDGVYAIVEARP